MAFRPVLSAALLDHFFGKSTYTPPALYVGLSTTTGSTTISEVGSSYGYTRVAVPAADWNAAVIDGNAYTTNLATITFPTATGSWGTIREVILCDASSGGTVLGRADAAIDKTISDGDVVVILPDKLKFILL